MKHPAGMSAENEHVNQCRQQHPACRPEELHTHGGGLSV